LINCEYFVVRNLRCRRILAAKCSLELIARYFSEHSATESGQVIVSRVLTTEQSVQFMCCEQAWSRLSDERARMRDWRRPFLARLSFCRGRRCDTGPHTWRSSVHSGPPVDSWSSGAFVKNLVVSSRRLGLSYTAA